MRQIKDKDDTILIIDMSYKKDSLGFYEFVKPITDIVQNSGKRYFIRHYMEVNGDDLNTSKKVILCGAALKDNQFREDLDSFNWLKDYNRPILGICAGFQIVGLIFGAKLINRKDIGIKKITLMKNNALIKKDMDVYDLHSALLSSLNKFYILAEHKGEAHAILHKDRQIYGLAFHPEVRHKEIIYNFLLISAKNAFLAHI